MYVPSFSMPIATVFCPTQCAARTWRVPVRSSARLLWRPSITKAPRLTVKCCPVSIQPCASMWYVWIARARAKARRCE